MNSRTLQMLLAIAAAIAPLVGVFFWGWSVREVVLLYWVENVVIGFWQIVKMLAAGIGRSQEGASSWVGTLFTIVFFSIHYGGFCAVHGIFVLSLTAEGGFGDGSSMPFEPGAMLWGPFVFLVLLVNTITAALEVLPIEALWSILSLFLMRGLGVWQDFLANGAWKSKKTQDLMAEPYKHVVVLHIAILVGAFLVISFKGDWPILGLIVVGKLALDLREILRKKDGSEAQLPPARSNPRKGRRRNRPR